MVTGCGGSGGDSGPKVDRFDGRYDGNETLTSGGQTRTSRITVRVNNGSVSVTDVVGVVWRGDVAATDGKFSAMAPCSNSGGTGGYQGRFTENGTVSGSFDQDAVCTKVSGSFEATRVSNNREPVTGRAGAVSRKNIE